MSKKKLTLFDLDHTLLPIDSDYSWGQFTCEIGWTDAEHFARRNAEFYEHYQAGTLDIHDYVRFATDAIRRRGATESIAARAAFMRSVVLPNVKRPARALLNAHRDAGDLIAIVTATNEFVTRPIAEAFGVEELIAVELEKDAAGWLTGEIAGIPSMREGKVLRVEQWMAARGLDWLDVESTFYSDSTNDLPLLEKVDHPVATNPGPALREIAISRGWRILNLFEEEERK